MVNGTGAVIKHFTDLEAWKINHQAVLLGYEISSSFPKEERFGMTDQLRRALVSITSNIAEGWGHFHFANKTRYYYQARGSSCEVQNQLIIAKDLRMLSVTEYDTLKQVVFNGFKLINGLIRSIERTQDKTK